MSPFCTSGSYRWAYRLIRQSGRRTDAFADVDEAALCAAFEATDYVTEDDIVTTICWSCGSASRCSSRANPAGKTEVGKVLATDFDTDLIRLQCYVGLTAEETLYDWNYTKQLLAVQAGERRLGRGVGLRRGLPARAAAAAGADCRGRPAAGVAHRRDCPRSSAPVPLA